MIEVMDQTKSGSPISLRGEGAGSKSYSILITTVGFVMAFWAWGLVYYGQAFYMATLQEIHGWSVGMISSATTMFWFVGVPLAILVGWAFDKFGPRLPVVFAAFAIAAGLVLLGRLSDPWQLFAAYLLLALGYPGLAMAGISATLVPWFSERFSLALSIALLGASAGGAVMVPLLTFVTEAHGFRAAVDAAAIALLATMLPLALLFLRRRSKRRTRTEADRSVPALGLRDLLRRPVFWRITFGSALALGAQVGFYAHQVAYLRHGLDATDAALVVSVTVVGSAVGRLAAGIISTRMPLVWFSGGCFLIQASIFVLLTLQPSTAALVALCAVFGFAVGNMVLLPPVLIRAAFGTEGYGRTYGIANVGLFVGMGSGPGLAGLIYDLSGSYDLAFYLFAGLLLIAFVLVPKRSN